MVSFETIDNEHRFNFFVFYIRCKFIFTFSQKIIKVNCIKKSSQVWWCKPVIPTMWETEVEGSWCEASPRQKAQDPV
jgi:hypothetical protein